jgi:Zn-dependent protease
MPTLLLAWCLAVLLAGPLVLLVHELGHAAAALALTRGPVVVQTGRRAWVTPQVGRLTLALGPGGLQAGACWHLAPRTPRAEAIIAASGPLASVVTCAAAGTACLALHPPRTAGLLLAALAILAAFDAVGNLLPILHPARRTVTGAPQESDGRIVARCLGLAFAAR